MSEPPPHLPATGGLPNLDLAPGTEVVAEAWDERDLSGHTFERVTFLDVDLTGTTSTGAHFEDCTFRDVDLNASRHVDTAFVNCTFTRCSFFGARLEGCKLTGSTFDRCRFGSLEVHGGNWGFVGLPGADLRRTSFRDVRMREADLTGARLQDAALLRVDLGGATLDRADLRGCDLRGSDLSALDPATVRLEAAVIDLDQAVTLARGLGLDVSPDPPPED